MSYALAKTILGGAWMIDPAWVSSQQGLIMRVLQGGTIFATDAERATAQRNSAAKFVDPTTGDTLNQYVYTWDGKQDNPELNKRKNLIAIVPITGPITKYDGGCGEPGSINHSNQLIRIGKMTNVSDVVIMLDTPGGQVNGLYTLGQTIKGLPQNTIAYIDDGMACSAGMYIAVHCKEIVASKPTDTVGSIGVLTTLADFTGYYEKEGIKVKTIYAPQSTEKNLDWKEAMEKDNPSLVEAELERIAGHFIEVVSTNRPKAVRHAEKWNKGNTFFADEAVKIGLIDRIGSLNDIVKKAARTGSRTNTKSTMTTTETAMAAVLQAANATEFAVIAQGDAAPDAGFLLSENQIGNIAAAIQQATTQHQQALAELQQQLQVATEAAANATNQASGLQQQLDTAQQAATNAQEQVTTLTAERDTLQAKVAELGKGSSGTGTHVAGAGSERIEGASGAANGKPSWYKDDGTEAKLERATRSVREFADMQDA